jgi:hypothetical protein
MFAALDKENNLWGLGETHQYALDDAKEQKGFDGLELLVRECSDYVSEQWDDDFGKDVVLMFRAAKKAGETETLLKK